MRWKLYIEIIYSLYYTVTYLSLMRKIFIASGRRGCSDKDGFRNTVSAGTLPWSGTLMLVISRM